MEFAKSSRYDGPDILKPLQHPDALHLQSAIGWLELGNHLEANEELDNIQPKLRVHPLVLRVRWDVYAKAKRWDGALEISRTLTEMLPNDPSVWLLHANSFYFAGDYQAAYDIAKVKVETFPQDWKTGEAKRQKNGQGAFVPRLSCAQTKSRGRGRAIPEVWTR